MKKWQVFSLLLLAHFLLQLIEVLENVIRDMSETQKNGALPHHAMGTRNFLLSLLIIYAIKCGQEECPSFFVCIIPAFLIAMIHSFIHGVM